MRIISWNVNGFRAAAKKNVFNNLIYNYDPDFLFLQEIKCSEEDMDLATKLYAQSLRGDYLRFTDESTIPGRHGVTLFAKSELADEITWLPAEQVDPLVDGQREARLQAFIFRDILMLNTYTVNVRSDLSRLAQREAYDNAILALLNMWKDSGKKDSIVIGDFNVVSEAIDYHGGAINPSMAGMTESERASFKIMLKSHDLVDSFRELHPEEEKYSWWSYRGYARDSNKGWRLDYALTSPDLFNSVTKSDILTDMTGSDHAPIILEIREEV